MDRPQVAVADADSLVTDVMRKRGYPIDDFDAKKSRLVSVDHPDVVENYRRGHSIYIKTVEGQASTEDLRQAVISYRCAVRDLVPRGAEPRRLTTTTQVGVLAGSRRCSRRPPSTTADHGAPKTADIVERAFDELVPETLPPQRAFDLGMGKDEMVTDVAIVATPTAAFEHELVTGCFLVAPYLVRHDGCSTP